MSKILVADDSMFQRFNLTKLLRNMGHEVIEAKDGQECLDAVAGQAPDLVLLDLNMPRLNGFQVLAAMQERKDSVPVVVVSADIQESSRQRCLDMGVKAVLGKPVSEQALASMLNEALTSDLQ